MEGLGLVIAIGCLGWHRTATRGKTRQRIVDMKPRELMLRPDMVIDAYTLRLVQAADGDLNTISKHCFVHAERASTRRAEAALRKRRRPVASWFTANPSEVFNAKVNEGQYWGTRMLSTHRAVADDTADRRRGSAIPHRSTEATTFEFSCVAHGGET
jgi:hypothetical protein